MGLLEYWYAIEKKHKSDSSYKYIVSVKRACELISEEVKEISEYKSKHKRNIFSSYECLIIRIAPS